MRIGLVAVLLAGMVPAVLAQSPAAAERRRQPDIGFWVSLGAGPASFYQSSGAAALRASGTLWIDSLVFIGRGTASFVSIDGHESHDEAALLAGWRVGGRYLRVIPALGIARAHWENHGPCEFAS